MNTCYIIGAGEVDSLPFQPDKTDRVICADGGYEFTKKFGIKPDLVVGDFDSLGEIPDDVEVKVFPPEKDETDSFLAVRFGIEMGFEKFALYGLLGGRIDHTFSNFELLSYLVDRGFSAYAVGIGFMVFMVKNSSIRLLKKDSGIISIFSFSDESRGVSIKGLKYEVDSLTMTNSLTRGLSNEFCGKDAEISVEDGKLIVFEQI